MLTENMHLSIHPPAISLSCRVAKWPLLRLLLHLWQLMVHYRVSHESVTEQGKSTPHSTALFISN